MDIDQEKELIRRAKADPAAFGRLYDAYYPKIFGYALRRTGSLEAAQDITAETFFKALSRLWQFRWRGVPFSAWLYRIATNELNQYYRKGGRTVSLEVLRAQGFDPASAHTPEGELVEAQAELERHRDFLAYQAAISRLGQKYQEALALRFFEHKKFSEIASILGKSEGTVKSLVHRGLEQLRRMQPMDAERIIGSDASVRAKGYQRL